MVRWAIKYSAVIIVPASIFVITESKDLISLIYGSAYQLSPTFLLLYSIQFLYARMILSYESKLVRD
jgi:O-antigen/teichoic acid export membrane protein